MVAVVWAQQKPISEVRPKAAGLPSATPVKSVMNQEPNAREADLRKLATSREEDVATDAVVALIRLRTPNVTQLVVETLQRLSDVSVSVVLSAVNHSRDQDLKTGFARACLRRAIENPNGPKETRNHPARPGVTGNAALLLAGSANPIDRNLIEDALKMRPTESGLWLAISKMGTATPADLELARTVFQKEKGQNQIAAAAALAPGDPKARDFVVKQIATFLSGIGQIDGQTLVEQAQAETSQSGRGRSLLISFRMQIGMLATLQYVQIPEAERLVFEFIDSPNQWVRGNLGLIAAQRWPQRLTKTALTRSGERFDLLATAAVLHPEFLPVVRSLVPTEELNKRLAKLNDNPLSILVPNALFAGVIL